MTGAPQNQAPALRHLLYVPTYAGKETLLCEDCAGGATLKVHSTDDGCTTQPASGTTPLATIPTRAKRHFSAKTELEEPIARFTAVMAALESAQVCPSCWYWLAKSRAPCLGNLTRNKGGEHCSRELMISRCAGSPNAWRWRTSGRRCVHLAGTSWSSCARPV